MTPEAAAYTMWTGFIALVLSTLAYTISYAPRRLALAAMAASFAAFAIGGTVQRHHYRYGPAPADWIAAEVASVDDPIIRQDVRAGLAAGAVRGETISRNRVAVEIERQREAARRQRAAQVQKGALR